MDLFLIDLENNPYGFVEHCKLNEPEHVDSYWNITLN